MSGEWIKHDGKGMPVDGELFVDVRYLVGTERSSVQAKWLHASGGPLSDWIWPVPDDEFNIISYRIVEPHEPSTPSQDGRLSR